MIARYVGISSAILLLGACSSASFVVAAADKDADGDTSPSDAAVIDLAGARSGTVVNASSTCPGDFKVGTTNGVQATVVQSGASISVKLTGFAGVALSVGVGGDTLSGTVDGDHMTATLLGTNTLTDGACRYKWNVNFDGHVTASTISGSVTYVPQPVGPAPCVAYVGCTQVQTLALAPAPVDAGAHD